MDLYNRKTMFSKAWQFNRDTHGSLFDRGSSDSYYDRSKTPHYGGVLGNSGPRISDLSSAEIAEYLAGYEDNEKCNNKKY